MDLARSSEALTTGYELAFQEARRGLEDQERAVVELRSRAGILIASAAITTSFFGEHVFSAHRSRPATLVAIGCFGLLGLVIVAMLWPGRDWEFSLAPARFISTYLERVGDDPVQTQLIHRDLALHMGESANLNRRHLRVLTTLFRIGAMLLIAEVMAWLLALTSAGVR